ncbi:MAG: ABC transporter substrate-binding protein [Clostridia bacterium]|nr:ABC transporter substrate-binding protein [Clostridia bacterium]
MKKCFCLLLALMLVFSLCACAEETPVRVAALKGPTAMGMVQMMRDGGDAYEFTLAAAADEVTPKLVKGELDIAAVPANLASILYNNTSGAVRVMAINTLGVLYIAERGESVQSVEDLRGKTLYTAGKGSTPEYALNYILRGNGLDPEKDVTIEFKSEHAECLAALMSNPDAVAMLPQPFATVAQTKAEDMRIALDLTAEWDALQENAEAPSAMITGVVVARAAFLEENPDAAARFLEDYAASVAFTLENNAEAAQLIGEYGIFEAAVAEKALPYCNITFVAGEDMRAQLSGYLAELHAQDPASVGGSVPDDAFYFVK